VIKVLIWRIISILLTLLVTFLMTSDVKTATNMTVILHTILILSHYTFESVWEKKFNPPKKEPHWDD